MPTNSIRSSGELRDSRGAARRSYPPRIAHERVLEGSSIFDLDREFHRLIVSAGAGPRLTTLHQAIEPQTERYWRLYASSIINDLTLSTQEHEAIIDALLASDADGLENALKLNWENGCKR